MKEGGQKPPPFIQKYAMSATYAIRYIKTNTIQQEKHNQLITR